MLVAFFCCAEIPLFSPNYLTLSISYVLTVWPLKIYEVVLDFKPLFLVEKESDLYMLSFHDSDQFPDRIIDRIQLSLF